MSLIDNARKSIVAGVNDYASGDEGRLLSAARNVHAGVVLLFKEKLRRLSPAGSEEVLVKQNVVPVLQEDGSLIFKGTGKNTVDVRTIRVRFNSLGVRVPWKRLDRFSKERNNVEHYYTMTGPSTIEALLADACLIVEDFVQRELGEHPWTLLGRECFASLKKIAETAREKRKAHLASLKGLKSVHPVLLDVAAGLTCSDCGSQYLKPAKGTLELACDFCSGKIDLTDGEVIETGLRGHFAYELYQAARMKCEDPLETCPECGRLTLLVEEMKCLACAYLHVAQECVRCQDEISLEEVHFAPVCGYCHHLSIKDD